MPFGDILKAKQYTDFIGQPYLVHFLKVLGMYITSDCIPSLNSPVKSLLQPNIHI